MGTVNSSFSITAEPSVRKFRSWIRRLEQSEVEKLKSRIVRSWGFRALEHIQDLVPRRTGAAGLAGSFQVGHKENVFEVSVSKSVSYVLVGTTKEYAAFVNDGFSQEKRRGKFVPGEWRSGTFHYIPKDSPDSKGGGMVLTGKIIPGSHYMDKAVDRMGKDGPGIVEFEIKRLWAELGGGTS